MKTIATVLAACAVLLGQAAFSGAQAVTRTSGTCTGMTVTNFADSDGGVGSTSDTEWSKVIGLKFTMAKGGCVTIAFAAAGEVFESMSGVFNELHIRTLLDGNSVCMPGIYNDGLFGVPGPGELRIPVSLTRVCKNVAPGTHVVQVQLHSGSGESVDVFDPVLTVTHP